MGLWMTPNARRNRKGTPSILHMYLLHTGIVQDTIIIRGPGAESPVRLVGPGGTRAVGGRVVVPGDTVEVEITARANSDGKPKASASFEGSLKFSSITHSHAVVPPHPALDLDNDFTVELWLRLAPGAARDGRAKCAWSVVFAQGELEAQQQQQQQRGELNASSSSSISSSSSVPLSQRRRQRQRQRRGEQQGVPRAVSRAINFSDAAGSQHGDDDDATAAGDDGPNTEGAWSTEGPITTGDALAWEGAIISRAAAARRVTLLSLEPSVTRRAVDEAALAQLQSMGFPRDTARRSLEVARNDVRQAVEFCTNGIPNERLFISRGADALRLMARRAALPEGLAEAGSTTPSALSSPSSSTMSPAAPSSSPAQRPGNRLTQLHTYIARLNNQGADESYRFHNSPTRPATATLTSNALTLPPYRSGAPNVRRRARRPPAPDAHQPQPLLAGHGQLHAAAPRGDRCKCRTGIERRARPPLAVRGSGRRRRGDGRGVHPPRSVRVCWRVGGRDK